jgi:AraC-like DNA-binding protein
MSTVIRTDHLPPAERFAFWREVVSQTWVPTECSTDDAVGFAAELRSSDLGAIQVNVVRSAPYHVRRTPRTIARADPDMVKIVMPLPGSTSRVVVTQNGGQARLAATDFALYDTSRPYDVRGGVRDRRSNAGALTLMFARGLLPLPPDQIARLVAVPMTASEGIGALASRFLEQLATGIDHYRPAEAARLATSALDVLATRLAHELGGDRWVPPQTHKRALVARINAFIHEHLGDPELSPGTVAAAHHISLRYLHKLFQEQGETVAAWIRQRRLEACRRDLADPAQATRPVAAIATRRGFSNAAHFARVFKAAHGLTPQDYRRRMLRDVR